MSDSECNRKAHGPMRRVLGNFGFLMRGRGIAAAMTLGATAITARALGPAEFGRVVLIQTYVLLIRGLFKFRLFEAIVTFGLPLFDDHDHKTLSRLVRACRRVDRITSISATVCALLLAPIVGSLLRLDREHLILLTAFSLVLLSSGVGTDNGLLRLFDRFKVLGQQMTISPAIRLVGSMIAYLLGGPVVAFVAVVALAWVSEDLYLNWWGRREYKKRVLDPDNELQAEGATLSEFSGLKKFLWITYWQSNVDLVSRQLAVLLAGYLLGPTEAGLLRLARQFSTMLSKPATLLRQVVYLDLTRSWHQGSDTFKLIAYRTAFLGGAFGLLFVVAGYFFGDDLLRLIVGVKFIAAAPVLVLMLLAATFDLAASSLRSAAYAMGFAGKILRIYAFSAAIFLTAFIACTFWMGLIGAGIAACVGAALPPLAMTNLIRLGTPPPDSVKEGS